MPVELMPPIIFSFGSVVICATGRAAPTKWIWLRPVPPRAAAKMTVSPAPTTSDAAVRVPVSRDTLAARGDIVERGRGPARPRLGRAVVDGSGAFQYPIFALSVENDAPPPRSSTTGCAGSATERTRVMRVATGPVS